MTSILDRIRDKKTAQSTGVHSIEPSDISLRGTGLTKREGERATKLYERETAKAMEAAENPSLIQQETLANFDHAIEETLRAMEEAWAHGDIKLDLSQIAAVRGIMQNQFSVLIGSAGTGKTTVTRIIIEELAKHVKIINVSDTYFETVKIGDSKTIRGIASEMRNQVGDVKGVDVDTDETAPSIAGAAYTGRASQQFKRALPEQWHKFISTIHSMLAYMPEEEEVEEMNTITKETYIKMRRVFRPQFNESCKLPFTVFIFDEASMIPIPLWNEFIAATNPNVRILLIGDINQLPPVQGKGILGYAMRHWPVFELTQIHRQAAGNPIIANAHRILHGKMPENAANFHIIGLGGNGPIAPTGMAAMQPFVLNVMNKLHELKLYDPYRDAVIVPQNKHPIGQMDLNNHFRTMFNPQRVENGVILNKRLKMHTGTGHVYYAIGDKIMITENINTVEPPITNGMIGVVESINLNGRYDTKRAQVDLEDNDTDANVDVIDFDLDSSAMEAAMAEAFDDANDKTKKAESEDQRQASHVMTVKFETGQTHSFSTAGDYRRVTYGWVCTCHKAQGGEYPNVIIVVHSANAVMLCREWLYTAVTRARNNVYIICNERGLKQALQRQKIKGITLSEKIRSYIIETKTDDEGEAIWDKNRHPILWENKSTIQETVQ